jgi:predicted ATPase with chaperone activity
VRRAAIRTLSDVGLLGDSQLPWLEEVSLARHGILFFDDLPACTRYV